MAPVVISHARIRPPARRFFRSLARRLTAALACLALTFSFFDVSVFAGGTQTDIVGPTGSGQFGYSVTILPNGNIVVTDPGFDLPGPIQDVGAVHLYDGATLSLISTLTGSTAFDYVGNAGITVLTNGNFLVVSRLWDNGPLEAAGAVTWVDGDVGLSGPISPANSLVGATAFDYIGRYGVTALTNGNYVVRSADWDDGGITDVGAVTWGNGSTGTVGPVSAANSLVGSTSGDQIGNYGVTSLTNGHYVVASALWDNGGIANAGAVTWGDGTTGISGQVTVTNSLVGTSANDAVGSGAITALTNGNYVVRSPIWDNGTASNAGAVTWGNGSTGSSGAVSTANSLVGSNSDDQAGYGGVMALSNGNYVVQSYLWSNGAATNAGAVTWGEGTVGVSGPITASNSLVGTASNDAVGVGGITNLTNGNFVVSSSLWDNGSVLQAGAVTWGDGTSGVTGTVSASNSLVGTTTNDQVGASITALTNGNYVVNSPRWDRGTTVDAGAATWGDGSAGVSGMISASNSLIGTTGDDQVASATTALSNGNYVVRSFFWDNGSVQNVGAATWAEGSTGITGEISPSNSLVGSTMNDLISDAGVTALTNGNYVVNSSGWHNGAIANVGAVTWGDGATGITGTVSTANSLTGSTPNDRVGLASATALSNGNYVVNSRDWNNGAATLAGAVTWGNGSTGTTGIVSASNSLVGTTTNDQIGAYGITALAEGNYLVLSVFWDNGSVLDAGAVTLGNGLVGTIGEVDSSNSITGNVDGYGEPIIHSARASGYRLIAGKFMENVVTVFDALAPTSAGVEVSGRVLSAEGMGIGRARVTMTDDRGSTRQALTNPFGYFRFEDVASGESYILGVEARQYQFESRLIQVDDALTGIDFFPVNRGSSVSK